MDLDLQLSFLERPAPLDCASPWLLVLMHGVGSNEADLFGLERYVPAQFHVVSLRAPYAMGPNAYAWFAFDVLPDGGRRIDEAQEITSRQCVADTVAAAAEQLGIPAERVVVGGFSQGGIMSLSLLLTQPALLKAAVVWHSRLLEQISGHVAAPEAFRQRKLWLSHGTQDTVIPLSSAHAIRDRVAQLPVDMAYSEYGVGHTIAPQELRACMEWLDALSKVDETTESGSQDF